MRGILFRGKRIDNNEWVYGWFFVGIEPTDNGATECNYKEECTSLPYITDGEENFLVDAKSIGEYTGINDVNGDSIFEEMTVHQKSVVTGSPDIDITGEVKFYDGSWWIDSGYTAVLLFNTNCENKIVEER